MGRYGQRYERSVGSHTLKAGIFGEYAVKTESPFKLINSTIYFDTNSANPGDTNWLFANALLGNLDKYDP